MPNEWKALLSTSNISKQEQKNNPQAVLDVLKWFDAKANKQESKFMTAVKVNSGGSGKLFVLIHTNNLLRFIYVDNNYQFPSNPIQQNVTAVGHQLLEVTHQVPLQPHLKPPLEKT